MAPDRTHPIPVCTMLPAYCVGFGPDQVLRRMPLTAEYFPSESPGMRALLARTEKR